MARILIIDDDREFSEVVADVLRRRGHDVHCQGAAEDGLEALVEKAFDLVLLDNRMPGMTGLDFLPQAQARGVRVPVVLMTSAHNDRTVIQAMNLGAFAYIIKPTDFAQIAGVLEPVIREALEITRRPESVPIPQPDAPPDDSLIVGRSRAMIEVLMRIGRLSKVDETVLILGETGTGKDLVARAIHTNSPRRGKPFVVMNCTAFNENLLDDELFGHEAGAFTGAERLRKGRFEHASGGTLFLDEVGDMPLPLQAKLLRVLENREVVRIGSNDPIKVDVRVLAATHRDLKSLVREGKFRQDLFFRLEGMPIHLPPLRERKEDIELLAQCFLRRLYGTSAGPALHPAALARLREYPWPGNIRQLQKVLCRAVGACRGAQILAEDLDFGEMETAAAPAGGECADEAGALAYLRSAVAWAWGSGQADLWPLLQEHLERELLHYAASQPGISQVQLARRLGMARNTLRARLKQHGLEEPGDRE